MSLLPSFVFSKKITGSPKTVVTTCDDSLQLSQLLLADYPELQETFQKAANATDFTGTFGAHVDLITPSGTGFDRLVVFGVSAKEGADLVNWRKLGGRAAALLKGESASVVLRGGEAHALAEFAEGVYLRSYSFDKYKTNKGEKKDKPKSQKISLVSELSSEAKKLWSVGQAVCDGTLFARELVNEPTNILTTTEFAKRLQGLEDLGVEVQVLEEKELAKIGMRALLGVGQGSAMPSKVVVMRWNGGKAKDKPLAFVGKGVVFDTGGISIKPAGGMEDMKGDMGGAAAVSGLMKAVAGRKAKANIVGIVGLVENMPDGLAQRPGDIVTSLSGQTIEIINTDAEGRLVLGDLLW
ncbi:MAG: M17 family peptidase N-terminal domain-containing protein, partial [Hyphomicrobiales bacterium]